MLSSHDYRDIFNDCYGYIYIYGGRDEKDMTKDFSIDKTEQIVADNPIVILRD